MSWEVVQKNSICIENLLFIVIHQGKVSKYLELWIILKN